MACNICEHPQREDIETMLREGVNVDGVAETYQVDPDELRAHIMFHTTVENPQESIARTLKKREADMLADMAEGYMKTFTSIGVNINQILSSPDTASSARLTKQLVDLYLGVGKEIRETVNAIAELDTLLNGPKDENVTGLAALANAIRGSHHE